MEMVFVFKFGNFTGFYGFSTFELSTGFFRGLFKSLEIIENFHQPWKIEILSVHKCSHVTLVMSPKKPFIFI